MSKFLDRFVQEDDGAVTVDWVVLCALIVGVALYAVVTVGDGTTAPAESVGDYMANYMD
ncbi:MAG: hypothetical protein AAF408_07645 [Pseudomonadota bacterium]